MAAKNVQLICIGGTTQVKTPPYLELSEQWVSANLLTSNPSLERNSGAPHAETEKLKPTVPVGWKDNIKNLLGGSGDVFGLTEDTSARFLSVIESLIYSNNIPQVYIAHSRGCGLTILAAFQQHKKGKKIKRLVLLDPVSKNQFAIRGEYAKIARQLAEEGVEVVVYMACGKRTLVYESYCDLIAGTELGGKYKAAESADNNIKFIGLDTPHEGMYDEYWSQLKEKLMGDVPFNSQLYTKLVPISGWLGTGGLDKVVPVQYVKGGKTASQITGKSQTLKTYKGYMKKERWRTLIHKYAQVGNDSN